MSRSIAVIIIVFSCMFSPGCMSAHTERMANVNPAGWESRDTAVIVFPNADTAGLRDLNLIIRFDGTFGEKELDFVISTMTPDSTVCFTEDFKVFSYKLPSVNNKHSEIKIPYRSSVSLNREGDYVFRISHRNNTLKGINAVGVNARKD